MDHLCWFECGNTFALAKEETVVDDNIAGHFTWANVEQWIEKGLITPEQALGIRQELEMRSPIEVASEPAQAVAGEQIKQDLNLITIAYYFGAFMILLAYTFIVGLHWQQLGYTLQFAAT